MGLMVSAKPVFPENTRFSEKEERSGERKFIA
jgi:hypothetical protein